ncbi:hypothetical protein [Roseateles puraquae]|uniref:hypothetical protein n=1 Tax=Roseateles puraquae TaxID=431059 RepID=UPI0031D8ECF0
MPAKQSSFQIHDVFKPLASMPEVAGPVRVVDTVNFNEVIVISVDPEKLTVPYAIGYDRWIDMLDGGEVEKAPDPYLHLPAAPVGLPDGAAKRLKQVIEATTTLSQKPGLLHRRTTLSSEYAVDWLSSLEDIGSERELHIGCRVWGRCSDEVSSQGGDRAVSPREKSCRR